jgi:hypothetical protein
MTTDWLDQLYDSLDRRYRPEDVDLILASSPAHTFKPDELRALREASRWASEHHWSSMSDDFERAMTCRHALESAVAVFKLSAGPAMWYLGRDSSDAGQMLEVVEFLGSSIGWQPGEDWLADRFTARKRREWAETMHKHVLPKRQYNRRVRVLLSLESHARRMQVRQGQRRLVLASHSGLAHTITREEFRKDPQVAAFIAYYVARKNQRRQFSLDGRGNSVDTLAVMLMQRVLDAPEANWPTLARAYSDASVLARLTQEQTGQLMGQWSALMATCAQELERIWPTLGEVNREMMVVRRGMNSSGWNETAGAYNAARQGWISCLVAAGMGQFLDTYCPGKVMRLMAADLVRWHGGQVDPNTYVWAHLHLPWLVIAGRRICTRTAIEIMCEQAGLNPVKTGWTGPRAHGEVADFKPTPELVHGVTVADPAWAAVMRRAGVFSGPSKGYHPQKLPGGVPDDVVISDLPTRLPAREEL